LAMKSETNFSLTCSGFGLIHRIKKGLVSERDVIKERSDVY